MILSVLILSTDIYLIRTKSALALRIWNDIWLGINSSVFFELKYLIQPASILSKSEEGNWECNQAITLLAEAFPLCFSALYCHSLRGFGCLRFVLVVSVFSSAQKQPKQNASSQNREENGSTTLRNTREKPLLAGYQAIGLETPFIRLCTQCSWWMLIKYFKLFITLCQLMCCLQLQSYCVWVLF